MPLGPVASTSSLPRCKLNILHRVRALRPQLGPHELRIWDVWFLLGDGVWSFSFPLTGNPGPGILPGTMALLPEEEEEEEEKGLVGGEGPGAV